MDRILTRNRLKQISAFPIPVVVFSIGILINGCYSQETAKNTKYSDFGRNIAEAVSVEEVYPRNQEEVVATIMSAISESRKVRVRGSGHSMNSSTLPNDNEILLRTDSLSRFSFDEEGTITVGCGNRIHDILPILKTNGYNLPNIPGGGTGITVGGYIAAGGFDRNLERWRSDVGGFWENVRSVDVVTGTGDVVQALNGDSLFRFLFGGMGQLGVMVSATLDIVPDPEQNAVTPPYPLGLTGRLKRGVFEEVYPHDNDVLFGRQFESMFWYALFGPDSENELVRSSLNYLMKYHQERTTSDVQYNIKCIPVSFRTFMPPLLYPKDESFNGCAMQVFHRERSEDEWQLIHNMYSVADSLGKAHGFARYLQGEYVPKGPANYESYFGKDLYTQFGNLRNKYDPKNIINSGVVFP